METSLIALISEILAKAAKTKEGRTWVLIVLLTAFIGVREWNHAQERDKALIESNKKVEALLTTCEKNIEKDREIIDNLKWEINDLNMKIAIRDLR